MPRYPELSYYKSLSSQELQQLYNDIQIWSAQLALELDARDTENQFAGASQINTAVTTTNLQGITGGRIVYATSSGKFYGFNAVTSAWDAMT